MSKLNDPADKTIDAQADGQFQAVDRRAGYGDQDEVLARLIRWCKEGKQLAHSEMLALGKYIAGLEADAARLDWLADEPPFDGFADSPMDVYEWESVVAEQNGRYEPTDADRREAFRRMLDAARHPTTEETTT